jgi:hypothetical protein
MRQPSFNSLDHLIGAGSARPSALAVVRLNTNSNLVACMTGRSLRFSPLRTRPVYADLAKREYCKRNVCDCHRGTSFLVGKLLMGFRAVKHLGGSIGSAP